MKSPVRQWKPEIWVTCAPKIVSFCTNTNCCTAAHHEVRAMVACRLPPGNGRTHTSRRRGDVGVATMKMLTGQHAGRPTLISEHDFEIGSRIATVICGGENRSRPRRSTKDWLHHLETRAFSRAVRDAQDPGTHRPHAQDRQAAAQLTRDVGKFCQKNSIDTGISI